MVNEDYVIFETAKLLKEKGFDWDWSPFYSEQDKDSWNQNNRYAIPNPNYDATIPFDSETLNVVAPHVSLQMAMKWLREMHNISVRPRYDEVEDERERLYYVWFFDIISMKPYRTLCEPEQGYKTYEEACEAGIKYCLENLI